MPEHCRGVAGRRQRSAGVRPRYRVCAVRQRAAASVATSQHGRRRRHAVAERPRPAAVISAGAPAAAAAASAVDGVGERRLRAGERLMVRRAAVVAVSDVSRSGVGATAVTRAHDGAAVRLEPGRVVVTRVGRRR